MSMSTSQQDNEWHQKMNKNLNMSNRKKLLHTNALAYRP